MKQHIKNTYHELNGTVGYRMICDLLNRKAIQCSYDTVYSYMREMGIKAIVRRKKQPYTKGNQHHIFDNLFEQNFTTEKPNLVWCTDFTYLNLKKGAKRYNCSIIDLYDRSIIASLNSKWIDSNLAIETLAIALESHSINNQLILHSDQGSQVRQEVA